MRSKDSEVVKCDNIFGDAGIWDFHAANKEHFQTYRKTIDS